MINLKSSTQSQSHNRCTKRAICMARVALTFYSSILLFGPSFTNNPSPMKSPLIIFSIVIGFIYIFYLIVPKYLFPCYVHLQMTKLRLKWLISQDSNFDFRFLKTMLIVLFLFYNCINNHINKHTHIYLLIYLLLPDCQPFILSFHIFILFSAVLHVY